MHIFAINSVALQAVKIQIFVFLQKYKNAAYLTLLAVKICIFAFLQKYKNANIWVSILHPHPPRVTPSEIAYLTQLAVKICIFAF